MSTLPGGVIETDLPLDAPWRCVSRDGRDVTLEVRRVDDATYLLRQSSWVTWEAPVLFLLVGTERALLLDTGAVADAARCPVGPTVAALVERTGGVPLVVAHTHGHNDHTAGDPQLAALPRTTVVPKDVDAVRSHFRLTSDTPVTYDLGGRELVAAATPGHDPRSVTVVDPSRRLLLSGDTAYPGRLYVDDLPAARESLRRMASLAREHDVEQVVGCHVEVDARGRDYPVGVRWHDDEAPLPLAVDDLDALADAAERAPGPGVHAGRPMSLHVGPCHAAMARLAVRGLAARLTRRG